MKRRGREAGRHPALVCAHTKEPFSGCPATRIPLQGPVAHQNLRGVAKSREMDALGISKITAVVRAADTGHGERWLREIAFDAEFLRSSIRAYEPHRLHFLTETFTELLIAKAVREGDVVVDAGANRGYHTRHLLDAVGRGGRVHAFEPNPALAAALETWADPRLKVHQLAVGASPGTATLHVPIDDDGWGSLVTEHMEFDRELVTFEVDVARIDGSLCPGDVPTFVKLDVERSEAAALEGMGGLLGPTGPIVVFEDAADNAAARRLQRLRYEVMDLLGRPFDESDHQLVNLLAVPQQRASDWYFWPDRNAIETVTARYRAQFPTAYGQAGCPPNEGCRLTHRLRAWWDAHR